MTGPVPPAHPLTDGPGTVREAAFTVLRRLGMTTIFGRRPA